MTRSRYVATLISAFLAVTVLSHTSFWLISAVIGDDRPAQNRMLLPFGIGALLLVVTACLSKRPVDIAVILLAASSVFSGLSVFGRETLRWGKVGFSLQAASVGAALVVSGFVVLSVVRARGGASERA